MYIDCVMSKTFHFVFETNNNDEDKEFENLDHVYKALSNSTAWVMFSILKLNIAIGVAFFASILQFADKDY